MSQFLQQIRTHFNIVNKQDSLSLTLINPNITAPLFHALKQKFSHLPNLRKQQIIILETQSFTDQLLSLLAQSLPISLQQLVLDFTGCEKLKGAGFIDLFERISLMENIKKLHFDFSEVYEINDFVVEGLGMLLENLVGLEEFYLDLYEVDQISQDGYLILSQAIASLSNNNQNLQKLHIDLSANPQLTQDALQLLFQNFPSTNLKHFGFRILDIEHIGGGSFFKLAQKIKQMKQLQQINLCLSTFSNLNQEGIQAVIKSIGMLEKARSVTLNLSNIALPEKMLSNIQFGQFLQNLTLDISCNSQLSDRDLINLTQKIPNKNRLKTLSLNVDFCKRITEQVIQCLIQKISQNRSLRKISLPDRKYSHQFANNCIAIIEKSPCYRSFTHFSVSPSYDGASIEDLNKFQGYKQRQKLKRNIMFASYLVRNNKYLKEYEKDILKLFLK